MYRFIVKCFSKVGGERSAYETIWSTQISSLANQLIARICSQLLNTSAPRKVGRILELNILGEDVSIRSGFETLINQIKVNIVIHIHSEPFAHTASKTDPR